MKLLSELLGLDQKRGDIGIEIELEGDKLPLEVIGWQVKAEGSLRGKGGRRALETDEDAPREYVTRGPVPQLQVWERVERLNTALRNNGATPRLCDRASTHLHLNMSRETVDTLIGFCVAYAVAEPVLLRLCGPTRNGNLFCVPTYETWDLPNYVTRVCRAIEQGNARGNWPARGKYGALNPDPLMGLGSVEVRCFPNSLDAHAIQSWADILVKLRNYAAASTTPFDRMLDEIAQEPETFLFRIFGAIPRQHTGQQTPVELVHFGLEHAHEIREGIEVKTPLQEGRPMRMLELGQAPPITAFRPHWDDMPVNVLGDD